MKQEVKPKDQRQEHQPAEREGKWLLEAEWRGKLCRMRSTSKPNVSCCLGDEVRGKTRQVHGAKAAEKRDEMMDMEAGSNDIVHSGFSQREQSKCNTTKFVNKIEG